MFVTLNPCRAVDEKKIISVFDYTHPLFDLKAIAAQRRLWSLQGRRNTWFCGAYFGSGFHEDGLKSALRVVNGLGVFAPWQAAEDRAGKPSGLREAV